MIRDFLTMTCPSCLKEIEIQFDQPIHLWNIQCPICTHFFNGSNIREIKLVKRDSDSKKELAQMIEEGIKKAALNASYGKRWDAGVFETLCVAFGL